MGLEVQIRKMMPGDIDFVMSLVWDEGWNQTEKDWEILTRNAGKTCLIASLDEKPVGKASAIVYSRVMAWICMVLVKKEYRGMGISKLMLKHLLNKLERFHSVGLDATPAEKPIYEKLGFKSDHIILRLFNPEVKTEFPSEIDFYPEIIRQSDIPEIIAFDKQVFGVARNNLIESVIRNNPYQAWMLKRNGIVSGFVLGRQGRRHIQIGPISVLTMADAKLLLSNALYHLVGFSVLIDVPKEKEFLLEWLESSGFVFQRLFERMYIQENLFPGRKENQYAITGPEFG